MGGKLGMRMLNDSLIYLVQTNQVDPKEAYIKSVDKGDFERKLSALGVKVDPSAFGEISEDGPSAATRVQQAAAPMAHTPPPPPQPMPGQQAQAPLPHREAPAPAPEAYADPFDQFRQTKQ